MVRFTGPTQMRFCKYCTASFCISLIFINHFTILSHKTLKIQWDFKQCFIPLLNNFISDMMCYCRTQNRTQMFKKTRTAVRDLLLDLIKRKSSIIFVILETFKRLNTSCSCTVHFNLCNIGALVCYLVSRQQGEMIFTVVMIKENTKEKQKQQSRFKIFPF